MKASKKYIILAGAVLTAAAMQAQTLSTEVVVDRTVRPAERPAERPSGLSPRLSLPAPTLYNLTTAGYGGVADITRGYEPLPAIESPLLPAISPYRGYAAIGYFPTYNLGVSAGYRLIGQGRTSLSVWGQFDGENYKTDYLDQKLADNAARIGVDFNLGVGERSTFAANVDLGYSKVKIYDPSQSLFDGRVKLGWLSDLNALTYYVSAAADFNSYGKVGSIGGKMSEQLYTLRAGAGYKLGEKTRAGLDVSADFQHTENLGTPGIIGLTPYFSFSSGEVSGRIGVALDIETGPAILDRKLRVAPDVQLAWQAAPQATIYGNFGGGSMLNGVRGLRQITPYQFGIMSYMPSNVPIDGEIGVRLGSFGGFRTELFGAYAIADRWLMIDDDITYGVHDVKGWRAGVRLGYEYGKLLAVNGSIELAPSGADKAWYQWRDRAKYVATLGAEVHPLKPLLVGVGYEFRGGRTAGLGCKSDLTAHASWAFSDAFSVFARVENILGRRYDILRGIESQGVHGLVGVSLKF